MNASSMDTGSTTGVELAHQRAHLATNVCVLIHPRRNYRGVRTEPPRLEHGHGGFDPECPGHIAGGEHHTAGASAHNNRFVLQRRIVALFNAGIKSIAVDVSDCQGLKLRVAQQAR
jgi:hypothetical protein